MAVPGGLDAWLLLSALVWAAYRALAYALVDLAHLTPLAAPLAWLAAVAAATKPVSMGVTVAAMIGNERGVLSAGLTSGAMVAACVGTEILSARLGRSLGAAAHVGLALGALTAAWNALFIAFIVRCGPTS